MGNISSIIIRNANIIDGTGRPARRGDLAVDHGVISRISYTSEGAGGTSEKVSDGGGIVIDAADKYLLPGLMDSHLHLNGYSMPGKTVVKLWHLTTAWPMKMLHGVHNAGTLLECGYTTVRVMGMPWSLDVHIRDAVEQGILQGPRMLCSGHALSMTAGHGDLQVPPWALRDDSLNADGVDECIKAVRMRIREGVDFIKIHNSGGIMSDNDKLEWRNYRIEEIRAICEEAHAFERRVAAHAEGIEGVRTALLGGVDTIEHGVYLDDECIELLLEKKAFLIPTLCISYACSTIGEATGVPKALIEKGKRAAESHIKSFQAAYKAGVKIALGSDAFNLTRIGNNGLEYSLMAKAGMPPLDVIRAGTYGAADALGILGKTGTLEEGKCADLILLNGDPVKDMTILGNRAETSLVMKEGKILINRIGGAGGAQDGNR